MQNEIEKKLSMLNTIVWEAIHLPKDKKVSFIELESLSYLESIFRSAKAVIEKEKDVSDLKDILHINLPASFLCCKFERSREIMKFILSNLYKYPAANAENFCKNFVFDISQNMQFLSKLIEELKTTETERLSPILMSDTTISI